MTIVFDLFGVLLSSSFSSAQEKLGLLLNRPIAEIAPVYRKWEADFDLGRIDAREFWQRVNTDLGTNIDWQELDSAVLNAIKPLPGSFALLQELQAHPLALLSNTRREWYEQLDGRYHFSQFFNAIFLSYQLRLCKPDPRIYARVQQELSLPPQQILCIDDSAQNIAAAAALGMPGILFTSATKIRRELLKYISFDQCVKLETQ
ncbi:MAG TPA: HAD family phosphatase [bacterium]|nr:HAD family phosphatase [bacterium]HPN42101.1 HAD family phosphatase [bacterium]